jgi:hypothetical protein
MRRSGLSWILWRDFGVIEARNSAISTLPGCEQVDLV